MLFLITFSPLAAVIIAMIIAMLTTFSATSDEKFIQMTFSLIVELY